MTDLTEEINDAFIEPVAAKLPLDMSSALKYGAVREIDQAKVLEWSMMKFKQANSRKTVTITSEPS